MQKQLGSRLQSIEGRLDQVFPAEITVTTTSTAPAEIALVAVSPDSAMFVEIIVVGRRADGSQVAAYKRNAAFNRIGSGAVQEPIPWDDDGTFESSEGFAFLRVPGSSSVSFQVVAESNSPTKWVARVRTTEVTN